MAILASGDFTGTFALAVNSYNADSFDSFFEKIERQYLVKLLGAELYGLFYDDLSGDPAEPVTDKYVTIFEPLVFDDGLPYVSNGIKEMLKGIVYYHWVRDNQLYDTIAGLVTNNIENSTSQSGSSLGGQYITNKYVEALENFDVIQRYINKNLTTYPEFNGVNVNRSPFFW